MGDNSLVELHRRACAGFGARVAAITAEDWTRATPCEEWDVRDLVNHLVVEDLWTRPMLEGSTIEEVGDRFDGDQLGDDPHGAWRAAADDAVAAVSEPGALDRVAHLSFGDTPAEEYVMQLLADHVVHAYDLAVAIDGDTRLDPELVEVVAAWFDEREELYRSAGVIGPAAVPGPGAGPQERLLARFGRL